MKRVGGLRLCRFRPPRQYTIWPRLKPNVWMLAVKNDMGLPCISHGFKLLRNLRSICVWYRGFVSGKVMIRFLVMAWLFGFLCLAAAQVQDFSDESIARLEALGQEALEEAEALVARSQPEKDRFELYTGCRPIAQLPFVSIENSSLDLAWESIFETLHNRLQATRIYDDAASDFISVNVHVVGSAFSVEVEFNKRLYDQISDIERSVTTWTSSALGTHGNNNDYVLLEIYKQVDHFLAEYLRINEC